MTEIPRNETTSDSIAGLAARILQMDDGQLREFVLQDDGPGMIRSVVASALTQAADHE